MVAGKGDGLPGANQQAVKCSGASNNTNGKQHTRFAQKRKANRYDLSKLMKLHRLRCRTYFIRNDEAGRAMFLALLHCGLPDDDARRRAPWAASGLARLRRRACAIPFDDLGPLIRLTYA